MCVDRKWYQLGRFHILARPLDTNPYWTTHHIYLQGECIGKQLSVPTESDCEWYAAGSRYSRSSDCPPQFYSTHRKPGPGRPRKDRYRSPFREFLEALAG